MRRFPLHRPAGLFPWTAALFLVASGCAISGGENQLVSAGPRVGVLFVTGDGADYMEAQGLDPIVSLLGWQFELQYGDFESGLIGLLEFVPFLVGADQEMNDLSLNVLYGVRSGLAKAPQDFEFAAGLNWTPETESTGLVLTAGYTRYLGRWSLPINIAAVSSKAGWRYSITFGWNLAQPPKYKTYKRRQP